MHAQDKGKRQNWEKRATLFRFVLRFTDADGEECMRMTEVYVYEEENKRRERAKKEQTVEMKHSKGRDE